MADDRYKWLDGEAAERLLRGLPVNARSTDAYEPGGPGDSGGRSGAQPAEAGSGESDSGEDRPDARLAAALSRLVAENAPPAGGRGAAELPGEAAAVDAFRAAHAEMPGSVTLGRPDADEIANRRCGGRRRPSLRGRPVRAGFVTALAGCALGGVAVAAGTGVLPAPFGGNAPVTKVSPANSRGAGNGGAEGSDQQASPGGSESSESGDDKRRKDDGRNGGSTTPGFPEEPRTSSPPSSSADADREARERKKRLAKLFCVAYEKDELAADDRRKFERMAGGPRGVKLLCARHGVVVSETSGGQSGADGGTGSSDSGGRPGSGPGDEGPDGDSGGTGHGPGGAPEGNSGDGSSGDGATDGTSGDGKTGETAAKSTGPGAAASDGASASPDASPSTGNEL